MKNKFVKVMAAGVITTLAVSGTAFAKTGWVEESNGWHFYTNNGTEATETWKQSGEYWYYLGSDGIMETNSFIEDDDNYYYVNEYGTMVTNEWRYLETDDTDEEARWYYFGSNGKAYKQGDSSSKAQLKEINGKKYIFDNEGKMLYGWINEDGTMAEDDDDDAWKEAMYYAGEEQDGAVVVNDWRALDVENDEDDDYPGYYWFYFKNNGKKTKDESSYTINGKKYGFDEYGAMVTEWSSEDKDSATASNAIKYYGDSEDGSRQTGWFKAVPDEDIDPEGYDDGEEVWYYAKSNGEVYKGIIKGINGKKYGFDEYGKMLTGIRALEVSGNEIVDVSDELEDIDDVKAYDGTGWSIYFFDDSGVMAKGNKTLKIDGDTYSYSFATSGEGKNGIYSNTIYVNGRRIEADSDEGYTQVDLDGKEVSSGGYLVNTSGKIQKNAKNKKDKNDMYYCTDSDGIVTYYGSEKSE